MTHARGQYQTPGLELDTDDAEDTQIPWLATDPRRAPLRNDLITALQVALCPVVFWFIFFTGYYPFRGAVAATAVMTVITFGVSFVLTWARMATARRRRATIRTPRRKVTVAAVVAFVVGAVSVYTSSTAYPDWTTRLLLGLAAGMAAAVILLVAESYAVSVPAVDELSRRDDGQLIPFDNQ